MRLITREVLGKLKEKYQFTIQSLKEQFLWNYYYAALREPKEKCGVPHDPKIQNEIVAELKASDFNVKDYRIDVSGYLAYIKNAQYNKYPAYMNGGKAKNFVEKSLEHYLAAKFLNLNVSDVYIDIASSDSPAAEIYSKLYGLKFYKQDLLFCPGLHGNIIGGDASNIPLEDGFATKMGLHCSFEHFEQDSDVKFIKEASRVLRKGGRLCILPLYMFNKYAIQTDPVVLPKGRTHFESDAVLRCVKNWPIRHSRFYDVAHLISRIRNNLNNLEMCIYVIENEKEIDTSCYVKFVALFEKI
jgi:SAM-dependent methyltransferase